MRKHIKFFITIMILTIIGSFSLSYAAVEKHAEDFEFKFPGHLRGTSDGELDWHGNWFGAGCGDGCGYRTDTPSRYGATVNEAWGWFLEDRENCRTEAQNKLINLLEKKGKNHGVDNSSGTWNDTIDQIDLLKSKLRNYKVVIVQDKEDEAYKNEYTENVAVIRKETITYVKTGDRYGSCDNGNPFPIINVKAKFKIQFRDYTPDPEDKVELKLNVNPVAAATAVGAGEYEKNTTANFYLDDIDYERYEFLYWQAEDGSTFLGEGDSYSSSKNMDKDYTYTAQFKRIEAPAKPKLTLKVEPTVAATAKGAGEYEKNEVAEFYLTDIDAENYTFSHWQRHDGTRVDASPNLYKGTQKMDQDYTYTAYFNKIEIKPKLTLKVEPEAAATARGAGEYTKNATAEFWLENINTADYRFVGWVKSDGTKFIGSGDNHKASQTMDKDYVFVAKFENLYNLTTIVRPSDSGTVSRSVNVNGVGHNGPYPSGTKVTLTANPNDISQKFTGWQVTSGGNNSLLSSTTATTTTLTMPGDDVTVEAGFEKTYNLIINVEPAGSGRTTGQGAYAKNTSPNITATHNENYMFNSWEKVSGGGTIANTSISSTKFTMPENDATIKAKFDPVYTLTLKVEVDGVENGEVADTYNNCANTTKNQYAANKYRKGTTVTFGIDNIKDEYVFKGWKKENASIIFTTSMESEIQLDANTTLIAVLEESVHIDFWDLYPTDWERRVSSTPGSEGYYETIRGKSNDTHNTKKINPEYCPDINNLTGDLTKYLYYIGEPINFTGDLCTCTTELSYKVHCNLPIYKVKNGKVTEEYTICNATKMASLGKPTSETEQYNATVDVSGIELISNNDSVLRSGTGFDKDTTWYVKEWTDDAGYSDKLGTHYGTITITSSCGNPDCVRTAYLPGPKPNPKLYNSKLIIKINPENAGSATVKYNYVDSNNAIQENTVTLSQSSEIWTLENSTVSITAKDGSSYSYINTTDGNNVIHEKEDGYSYTVNAPPKNETKTISVNFVRLPNLYVTSTEGGSAYIKSPSEYENKTTVNNVTIGKIITIEYKVDSGYKFLGWEYDREVEKTENRPCTEIKMPGYDLTVKAKFEKEEAEYEYKLYADVNNSDFGDAWVKIGDTKLDETSAISGSTYTIGWVEYDGYEFDSITYDYTAYGDKPSPIISTDTDGYTAEVKMVKDSNLRITINLRLVPPPASYNVDYLAEPEEGGTVSDDRTAYEGEQVPLIATPNEGYKLSGWRFENANGAKIYPTVELNEETKCGYFIMPGYHVRAIAEFKKVPTYRDITVIIVGPGSGTVKVDGEEITSGSIINGVDGSTLRFEAIPDDDSDFGRYTDGDGKELSEEEIYSHIISGDITIVIKFEIENIDDKGPYTLYVSSLYGGDAKIVGVYADNKGKYDLKKDVEPIGPDKLDKTIYKLENVYAGDRFIIAYEITEEGYKFGSWEYKPHISPDSEGNTIDGKGTITITMPASDLTVTAVFKNDDVKLEPKLSVTTNNPEWGSAWTFIGKEQTVHDKKYEVKLRDKYTLEYEAKPGYYFVNWNYSTTETPFIDENEILIPAMNLEVMAMFSPIPEGEQDDPTEPPEDPEVPNPGPTGHIVDFVAEPEEGGRVPDDLENILPGCEVTIAVTVNKGWEFDKWIFKTPDGVEVFPDVEYDPITGTGSFIMPDYEIKAIAVFKEKEHYTLYITHYYGGDAWTYDNDGTKTTVVEKAYVGCAYPIEYTVDSKYEFVNWEFRWDKFEESLNSNDINPMIAVGEGMAIMPRSDMTVTAVFKEKSVTNSPMVRVSTNNTLWGDAWIVIDGKEYHWKDLINDPSKQWLNVTAGEFYDVYFKAEEGFEFTNWSTIGHFPNYSKDWAEYIKDFDYNKYFKTVLEMPNEKLEIMAFFKPGDEEQPKFTLKVKADPEVGGNVSIGGNNTIELEVYATEEVKIKAVANSDYEFKEWYYEVKDEDGTKQRIIFSGSEEKTFRMPPKNLTLIADFDKLPEEDDKNGGGGGTEPDYYDIVINKIGDGSGTITVGSENIYVSASKTGIIKTISVENGTEVKLGVTTDRNTTFVGWYRAETLLTANLNYTVTVNGKDIVITVNLDGNNGSGDDGDKVADSFKIVSVRDLNWMDYFIENGRLNPDRYFSIADSTSRTDTMLQNRGDYEQPIKMGYAVEFELITTGINEDIENLQLRIEPKLYEAKNGKAINTNNLFKSYGTKLKGSFDDINNDIDKYERITIKKNSNGTYPNGSGNFMEYMKPNDNDMIPGSRISENEILWRWVYYLPADTYIPKDQKSDPTSNELIVDFDIGLYIGDPDNPIILRNIVVNARDTFKQNWDGYVFRYSLTESLLDDIYDNAQN